MTDGEATAVDRLEALRRAGLGAIHRQVTTPEMWVIDARDLAAMVSQNIAVLQECDGVEHHRSRRLERYGKLGITEPLQPYLGDPARLHAVVAIVMAHEAHRLGYLDAGPVLSRGAFAAVRSELRERFDEVDLCRSEVEAELGPPTFACRTGTCAYGSTDLDAGWIFFAFDDRRQSGPPVASSGERDIVQPPNHLLRVVWTSEGPFQDTLSLTTYAKLETWGSGWTSNHSWRGAPPPDEVADQLQHLHGADPSQSLQRPGSPTHMPRSTTLRA